MAGFIFALRLLALIDAYLVLRFASHDSSAGEFYRAAPVAALTSHGSIERRRGLFVFLLLRHALLTLSGFFVCCFSLEQIVF
jgi:phage terminase large subunit-like protein